MTAIARLDNLSRELVWKTQDGRDYKLSEMTDSHLYNTVRMLCGLSPLGTQFRTTNRRRWMWILAMTREAHRRGLTTPDGRPLLEPILLGDRN